MEIIVQVVLYYSRSTVISQMLSLAAITFLNSNRLGWQTSSRTSRRIENSSPVHLTLLAGHESRSSVSQLMRAARCRRLWITRPCIRSSAGSRCRLLAEATTISVAHSTSPVERAPIGEVGKPLKAKPQNQPHPSTSQVPAPLRSWQNPHCSISSPKPYSRAQEPRSPLRRDTPNATRHAICP